MIDRALALVNEEVQRQAVLWGPAETQRQSPEKRLTILVEEVGEYAEAVLEHRPQEAQDELVQIAAVAVSNIVRYMHGLDA